MGHYQDFLEQLLKDNVMNDYDKIIRSMAHSESQSKLNNTDWHYRQQYCHRAQRIKQKQFIQIFRNSHTRIK
jgi:hypothetical protein